MAYIFGKMHSAFSQLPVDYEQMTLEHLASQNARGGQARVDESHVAQVGNLVLVSRNLNRRLANKPFAAKMDMLREAGVWLDDELSAAEDWGEPEIEQRTKALAKLAYDSVWRL